LIEKIIKGSKKMMSKTKVPERVMMVIDNKENL